MSAKVRGDLLAIARKYVRACMERESPPKVKELAGILNLSRDRLNELFVIRHRITATRFLKNVRLEEAKRLLRETSLPITKVAYRAGFRTRRNFHRAFLQMTGMTPGTYRRNSAKRP